MYYSSQQYAWLRSLALYLGLVAVVMQVGNGNIVLVAAHTIASFHTVLLSQLIPNTTGSCIIANNYQLTLVH